MVKIAPLIPYLPKNPAEFCVNPYDVIDQAEEKELKKNPNSLVHLTLPDGEGDKRYANAAKAYADFKKKKLIAKQKVPAIYVYRQESPRFSQQGFILGLALEDYGTGGIIEHERTREAPLRDRIQLYSTTKLVPGLVWTVFKADAKLNGLMERIKNKTPKLSFEMKGYKQLLWEETDPAIIEEAKRLFADKKVYIADGHHRCAAAVEYRRVQLQKNPEMVDAPWQYVMAYAASDDQIRILPYNRVIRELPLPTEVFLEKLTKEFIVEPRPTAFNPTKRGEIAMCARGKWYLLKVRLDITRGLSPADALDVSILQRFVLGPILGIKDPGTNKNLFFVGGFTEPRQMEKYVTEKDNAIFFSLFPVSIKDVEKISENGGLMPPKSTWFDPKLLSGLLLHELDPA